MFETPPFDDVFQVCWRFSFYDFFIKIQA